MSIKDLFNKNIKKFDSPLNHVSSASIGAESNEYIIAKQEKNITVKMYG